MQQATRKKEIFRMNRSNQRYLTPLQRDKPQQEFWAYRKDAKRSTITRCGKCSNENRDGRKAKRPVKDPLGRKRKESIVVTLDLVRYLYSSLEHTEEQ